MQIKGSKKFEVYKISKSGMAWAAGEDGSMDNVCLGPIDCSEGEVTNAVLVTNKSQAPYKCGICTDTDLWEKTSPDLPNGGLNMDTASLDEEELIDYPERVLDLFVHKEGMRGEIQGLISSLDNKTDKSTSTSSGPAQNQGSLKKDFSEISGLYFVPVSDYWRDEFQDSVENPLDLSKYEEVPPQLQGYDELRIWATTETDAAKKQAAVDQMEAGDFVLFYYDGEFFFGGSIERTFESPKVGELIWNQSESRYIYILDDFTADVPPIEKVWDWVGYEGRKVVRGFTRVDDDRVKKVTQEQGSLQTLLLEYQQEPADGGIEKEERTLTQNVDSSPQLIENEEEYTESRRRARDSVFVDLVRGAYNRQCAFCRSSRESPAGNPEVEAAHIYPKREGGTDDVRNGISLCKLHHWAFDTGWLSISDEHRILVNEAPECNGYHEFKQLEERKIRLPDEEEAHPHPMFLEKHREIHGFTND